DRVRLRHPRPPCGRPQSGAHRRRDRSRCGRRRDGARERPAVGPRRARADRAVRRQGAPRHRRLRHRHAAQQHLLLPRRRAGVAAVPRAPLPSAGGLAAGHHGMPWRKRDDRDSESLGRADRGMRPPARSRRDSSAAACGRILQRSCPAPRPRRAFLRLPGLALNPALVASATRVVLRIAAMDLTYSPEELAFQREVRTWLKRNVPKHDRSDNPVEGAPERGRITRAKAWQRKVYDAGYLAMGWPREYGGQGADVMRQTIVNEEMVRARAPGLIGMMGIQMVGPTLIAHGTEEQRKQYL